ncbi:TPA: alginate O-acetyltransferase AlgX-related protein, partial [Clostridioides difficile]
MNRFFKVRLITAIMFLIVLFAFSIFNICYSGKDMIQEIKNLVAEKSSLKDTISSIDNTVNDKVIYKNTFIETYGYLQKLMGKNEFSKFSSVKDTSGKMHYTYFAKAPNPIGVISDRVRKFSEEMEKQNTKLVYLMTPDKYIQGVTKFPKGIPYSY